MSKTIISREQTPAEVYEWCLNGQEYLRRDVSDGNWEIYNSYTDQYVGLVSQGGKRVDMEPEWTIARPLPHTERVQKHIPWDSMDEQLYNTLWYIPLEIWEIIFEYVRWMKRHDNPTSLKLADLRPYGIPLVDAQPGDIVAIWEKKKVQKYWKHDISNGEVVPPVSGAWPAERTDEQPIFVKVDHVIGRPHPSIFQSNTRKNVPHKNGRIYFTGPMIPEKMGTIQNGLTKEQWGDLSGNWVPHTNWVGPYASNIYWPLSKSMWRRRMMSGSVLSQKFSLNTDGPTVWEERPVWLNAAGNWMGGDIACKHFSGGVDGFVVSRGLPKQYEIVRWTEKRERQGICVCGKFK